MTLITTVPTLLKTANVSQINTNSVQKILNIITDNKIRLEGEALKSVAQLLKSAPEAMTTAHNTLSQTLQKSLEHTDNLSINHIKNLINLFISVGVSDERMYKLLDKITTQEHEIRSQRTDGWFTLGNIFIVGVSVVAAIFANKPHKKLWEK